MTILTVLLIILLVILFFRVGLSLLRFIIKLGAAVLLIYLAYKGIIWLLDFIQVYV